MPGPTRYRNLVRDTALALRGQAAALDTQALVLEQIMQEDVADRLILSWENFLSFGLRPLRLRLWTARFIPQQATGPAHSRRCFRRLRPSFIWPSATRPAFCPPYPPDKSR